MYPALGNFSENEVIKLEMPHRLRNRTILVAEDDFLVAQILVDLVKLHGGTVLVAPSRAEALEIARKTEIDVALLDIMLNDGPCVELAEKLIAQNVPVILTTGYRATDIPDALSDLAVFQKPWKLEALVQGLVDKCLNTPGAAP